jgi:hypothetical protein
MKSKAKAKTKAKTKAEIKWTSHAFVYSSALRLTLTGKEFHSLPVSCHMVLASLVRPFDLFHCSTCGVPWEDHEKYENLAGSACPNRASLALAESYLHLQKFLYTHNYAKDLFYLASVNGWVPWWNTEKAVNTDAHVSQNPEFVGVPLLSSNGPVSR